MRISPITRRGWARRYRTCCRFRRRPAWFGGGTLVGPATGATGLGGGSAFFTVASAAPLYSTASNNQLDQLHAVPSTG